MAFAAPRALGLLLGPNTVQYTLMAPRNRPSLRTRTWTSSSARADNGECPASCSCSGPRRTFPLTPSCSPWPQVVMSTATAYGSSPRQWDMATTRTSARQRHRGPLRCTPSRSARSPSRTPSAPHSRLDAVGDERRDHVYARLRQFQFQFVCGVLYAVYPSVGGWQVSGSGNGDGGGARQGDTDGDGEGVGETILGAQCGEVEVEGEGEGDGPRPTTRRLLTLTYAAGLQVWDTSSLGGVEEATTSSLGRAAGTKMERTSSLRGVERSWSSVDTLRAVDVGNIDKQRKGANTAILPSRSRVGKDGAGRVHAQQAFAPLSTFTSAPRVLLRTIYPSHQFAFYTLGEDYHALIRRYQFAIGGAKIDVWREVEVSSAYISFASKVFVERYAPSSSSPRAIRRQSHAAQHPWTSRSQPSSSALGTSQALGTARAAATAPTPFSPPPLSPPPDAHAVGIFATRALFWPRWGDGEGRTLHPRDGASRIPATYIMTFEIQI
ncbi:hypothetical protein DFH08DRAFT_957948 [Mycena albidolilacea]|uniref:Uncharacterized protein n=1 Tax=Mycena albidolilacea TaxID=1033008 RepID=A0AAD7EWC9_9AGAR|nr:hypothetical protein DFH08DRAFT_957948 [Mycena albidolilacea]